MKLIKDGIITNQTDKFIIEIYKSSGWEEVKEAPKVEPKVKVDESDKKEETNYKVSFKKNNK